MTPCRLVKITTTWIREQILSVPSDVGRGDEDEWTDEDGAEWTFLTDFEVLGYPPDEEET